MLAPEHAPGILSACAHLACVAEDPTVAQRCAELLTLLLAARPDKLAQQVRVGQQVPLNAYESYGPPFSVCRLVLV